MSNLQKAIVGIIGAAFIGLSVFTFIKVEKPPAPPVVAGSASTFSVVEGIPYTISNTVGPTDTSVTISSFNSPGGLPFTMSNFGSIGYATLDPTNLARLETISFTGITNNGSSVTLTGVTRGIDFVSPYSASTTLERIHLVGSTLILSNPAAFYGQQFALLNATSTISGQFIFSSTTAPRFDFDPGAAYYTAAASSTYVDQAQLTRTALAGTVNANATTNGVVQLATALQAASSTITGTTGANDVLWSKYATDTPSTSGCATSGGGCVVMSLLNGKLNQLWLDLTQAFTFTSSVTVQKALITSTVTLSDAATTTVDWSAGNTFVWTLTGNHALVFTNIVAGESIKLFVCQDGTGSRTIVNYPNTASSVTNIRWFSKFAPVLSTAAGTCDLQSFSAATSSTSVFGGFNANG